MKSKFKLPQKASLSIIIPAYNSEKWIGPTLKHLAVSLAGSKWQSIEILVIDDGSKDKTTDVAKATKLDWPLKIVRQPNSGRLKARELGIKKAKGDYVLMLDSRVYAQPGAFSYLVRQMSKNPGAVVWNGHIIVERQGNPFARFWYGITFLAWRRYMKKPKLTHYNQNDFDYFPKGAGCFFAPRQYLFEAYKNFTSYYSDSRHANDDTSLIRYIAKLDDIYISPGFAFTYNSRSTLGAFIRHTVHRGVVFIDGYFHRGGRYFYAALLYLMAVPIMFALLTFQPLLLFLIVPLLVLIFIGALIFSVPAADAAALAYVLPVFAIFYTAGLYKGLFLKLSNQLS
jgi:glycosyltransferase involved in cell wall biosynthesis